jgi:hypothetical protein
LDPQVRRSKARRKTIELIGETRYPSGLLLEPLPIPPPIPSMDASLPLPPSTEFIDPNSPQQPGFTGILQPQQATSPSVLASQLFTDTLKMITPVGQSPNDEQLLVMALQSGLSQGLDHRRAIERLHGVCSQPHVFRLPLNSASRSITTPPICGRIII